ncbi:MAG: aminotransferase [Clostridiales bacterium]|nr:aminotransferase [Clostridiales bacterium]
MKQLAQENRNTLLRLKEDLTARYDQFIEMNLSLDMTRGKPCPEQLDIASDIFNLVDAGNCYSENMTDCRNYGVPTGIDECKNLLSMISGFDPSLIIVGNNSSLSLMYDTLMRAMVFGEIESARPWGNEPNRKWICPVPGYDRHFAITQTLGFQMIPVKMNEDGPDMDQVENLVATDLSIKGMWCVPLYSNPDGYVYSSAVCKRLAKMKTAADDFRVLWDNAYAVHHLYPDRKATIPNILYLSEKHGHPNRFYAFSSTSKITMAGSGISCIASNPANIERVKKQLSLRTIGPDKLNQLRHVRYIPNVEVLGGIMEKHAQIIRPKFEAVEAILREELGGLGIARWNDPQGGYFFSLFLLEGTAKKVVNAAKSAGVSLTPAGATYPYGIDPDDSNIRIAPTFPSLEDIKTATRVLCVCAKLEAIEKLLGERKD